MPSLELLAMFRFDKSGPRLTGTLPSLDGLPSLRDLLLQGNELHGTIPSDFVSASKSIELVLLDSNLLTGTLPEILAAAPELQLAVSNNMISDVSQSLCDQLSWMEGAMEEYGCDALLCPPGTATSEGRASNSGVCELCPSTDDAPYYGSTSCTSFSNQRDILMNLYYAFHGEDWHRSDFWG